MYVVDFPPRAIAPYEIEVIHPDDFLMDLFDLSPTLVAAELERQAAANQLSPNTLGELLEALSRIHLTGFAEEVRRHRTLG